MMLTEDLHCCRASSTPLGRPAAAVAQNFRRATLTLDPSSSRLSSSSSSSSSNRTLLHMRGALCCLWPRSSMCHQRGLGAHPPRRPAGEAASAPTWGWASRSTSRQVGPSLLSAWAGCRVLSFQALLRSQVLWRQHHQQRLGMVRGIPKYLAMVQGFWLSSTAQHLSRHSFGQAPQVGLFLRLQAACSPSLAGTLHMNWSTAPSACRHSAPPQPHWLNTVCGCRCPPAGCKAAGPAALSCVNQAPHQQHCLRLTAACYLSQGLGDLSVSLGRPITKRPLISWLLTQHCCL